MMDARTSGVGELDPRSVADLMLGAALHGDLTLAMLEPGPGNATLSFERGGRIIARHDVPSDVGLAACARLAIAARLDPEARAGSLEGTANVARIRARAGGVEGELLVSIVARKDGLEAEIRVLAIDGRAPNVARAIALKRCRQCAAYQPAQSTTCENDGAALIEIADRPEPGGTIGQYVVGAMIGEGGDGMVFRGRHAVIGRPVAIKLLRPTDGELDARRFFSEARAASRLRHPNVVAVTDFGLLATGQPYIVMEELKGQSLYERIQGAPLLDPLFAFRVAREITLGLGVAHDAGIIHNDLKPSNVMLLEDSDDRAPRLKVLDFGASSKTGHVQESMDGLIFGTCEYMSPELGQGLPTDARSDLYALGVLLYEMLTGSVPFPGDDVAKVIRDHAFAAVPPLQRGGRPLPQQVSHVVTRCLRKSPEERPQSAGELSMELGDAIAVLERPVWRRWLP